MVSGKVLFRWFNGKIKALGSENLLTNFDGSVRTQVEDKVKIWGNPKKVWLMRSVFFQKFKE